MESIRGRVDIDGAAALAVLQAIGAAGEQQFQKLKQQAEAAGEGVKKIGEAGHASSAGMRSLISLFDEFERGQRGALFSTLGAAISRAGHSWEGFAAAATAAAGALYLFSQNAAESVHHLEVQAQALGTTAEKYGAMQLAATASGVSTEEFGVGMGRFAQAVGRAQISMQDNAAAADKLRQQQESLKETTESTALASDKAADSVRKQDLAIEKSALTVSQAKLSIDKLKDSYAEAELNIKNLTITEEEAERKAINVRADRTKTAEDVIKADNEVVKAHNAVVIAQQRQIERAKEMKIQEEELKIKVKEHAEAIKDKAIKEREAVIAQERAIEASRKQQEQFKRIGDAVGDMNKKLADEGGLNSVRGQINSLLQGLSAGDIPRALGEFADKFKSIGSEAEKAAVASRVLGENWRSWVPFLNEGSAGVQKLVEAEQKYVIQTKDMEESAKKFTLAQKEMGFALSSLKNIVGTAIGEAFEPVMKEIADAIANNRKGIVEFGESIKKFIEDAVIPFGEAFIRISSIVTELIIVPFKALYDILAAIFGDDATKQIIGYGGAILAFVKILGGLVKVMETLRVLTLTNPFTAWIAGFALIGAAILIITGHSEKLKQILMDLIGIGVDPKTAAGSDSSTSNTPQRTPDTGSLAALQGQSDFGSVSTPEYIPGTGRQGGGHVSGSGRGDTVHAMLEPGEVVIQRSSVEKFGLSNLLALNQGILPKFNLGGLVERLNGMGSPLRLASGGLVGDMGSAPERFSLSFEGRTYGGLSAPAQTAQDMIDHARMSNIISLAPRPSRKGGG